MYTIYPIAWIGKSPAFLDYISSATSEKEFLVADFASGEHDRVPSFFVNLLPEISPSVPNRTVVYCTDLHALRLDSLMGKLEESALLKNVRVVHAKLETMDEEATLRPDMMEHLENNPTLMTWLDHHLKEEKFFPQETFDVGILNNDVVGYLHEYYKEYSDAAVSLRKVYSVLKTGALLIVTMPCSLYVVDNVQILESLGYEFLEGLDIDLSDESLVQLGRSTEPQTMSRLGHYTFLIFVRK
jgi:SAM-dependent methyltransferase